VARRRKPSTPSPNFARLFSPPATTTDYSGKTDEWWLAMRHPSGNFTQTNVNLAGTFVIL
jgi:hypothetical protein